MAGLLAKKAIPRLAEASQQCDIPRDQHIYCFVGHADARQDVLMIACVYHLSGRGCHIVQCFIAVRFLVAMRRGNRGSSNAMRTLSVSQWQSHFYRLLRFILLCLSFLPSVTGIARFEFTSASTSSIVVRMISAANVTRYDMNGTIYDLDHRVEIRQIVPTSGRNDDELTFDGLLPGTWFAIRINYRLIYQNSDGGYSNLPTKQELIVRTKNDSRTPPTTVMDQVINIDGITVDQRSVNVSVSSVFAYTHELFTFLVPELRCDRGTLKPAAQVVKNSTMVHFDLRKMMHSSNRFDNPQCNTLCIFPFIRGSFNSTGQQTFRGKEWCGSLQEAADLIPSNSQKAPVASDLFIAFYIVSHLTIQKILHI
uniref:MG2 domain-containing protein n=1 Tax=Panagrellus redivivus TaxID=6233 RepID=A0A7E4W4W0_PANRE